MTRRPGRRALVAAGLGALLCWCSGLLVAGLLGAVGDGAAREAGALACPAAPGAGDPAGQRALDALDDRQRAHGTLIVEVGMAMVVPPRGWVVAVAAAMQESGLRNLPHQGARNDHDSLGLFQQRPSQGWGTPAQIRDPEYAATAFYRRLLQVPGWQELPVAAAADAVQRSANPQAYARHEPLATALVQAVAGEAAAAAASGPGHWCPEPDAVSAAGWTRPAPGPVWSGFRTANRPTHYGIDIGASRGTPVRAAADGAVTLVTCQATRDGRPYGCDVDGSPAVSGCGWYVDIRHGAAVTRYCHLLTRPEVAVGDRVVAGQRIGQVGSSGHSSGPHLHFEVEIQAAVRAGPGGIVVTRAQTDPVPFLAARGVTFECIGAPADCEPVHGDRVRTQTR